MNMGGSAEFRCGEGVVIVEPEYWGRIIVRACIRGLVEWVRIQDGIAWKQRTETKVLKRLTH